MLTWNVIVTVTDQHFKAGMRLLRSLGNVVRTHYYNVLALEVADIRSFLEAIRDRMIYPDTVETIARVGPAFDAFNFSSAEDFEAKAKEVASKYLPQLAGKRFHVRMHRRGWKEKLPAPDEERKLGEYLFDRLNKEFTPGHVDFEDPDAILAIETLDSRAGLALWTREELKRYPFLKLD